MPESVVQSTAESDTPACKPKECHLATHQQLGILIGFKGCMIDQVTAREIVKRHLCFNSDDRMVERWSIAARELDAGANIQAALQQTKLFDAEVNGILNVVPNPVTAIQCSIEYLQAVVWR